MVDLKTLIRDVPDFPKQGIIFKDITPLLADAQALRQTADMLAGPFKNKGIELVAGIESRGFIFGTMIAERLGAGFVPIRKLGKLPYEKISRSYGLEYGTATIELHVDAIKAGQKVLMVDDLMATGGTMVAACELVESLGGKVEGIACVVELCFLPGRQRLSKYNLHTLIKVDGE